MTTASSRIRIIEIDAPPSKTPLEVEAFIAPLVQEAVDKGADVKSGQLPDADLPESHYSYFVGARNPTSDPTARRIAEELFDKLFEIRSRDRLRLVEIPQEHPRYPTLVSLFGW